MRVFITINTATSSVYIERECISLDNLLTAMRMSYPHATSITFTVVI